jgi:hypothetical protein
MGQTTSTKQTLWQRLIEPHPDITDPGMRARARVLSIALLPLIAITIAVIGPVIALGGNVRGALIALALFAVSYALSRTRRPEIGAALLVYGLVVQVFIFMAVLGDDPGVVGATLAFTPIPVVLATLVMRWRGAIVVSAVTVAA